MFSISPGEVAHSKKFWVRNRHKESSEEKFDSWKKPQVIVRKKKRLFLFFASIAEYREIYVEIVPRDIKIVSGRWKLVRTNKNNLENLSRRDHVIILKSTSTCCLFKEKNLRKIKQKSFCTKAWDKQEDFLCSNENRFLLSTMSSRGFLLRIHDDDSYDQPEMRPLSPNIIVSRSDYFAAREEGEKWTNQFTPLMSS